MGIEGEKWEVTQDEGKEDGEIRTILSDYQEI